MIVEGILDVVFVIVSSLLTPFIPLDWAWDITSETFAPFVSIIQSICYFLPMGTVSKIVGVIVVLGIFRAGSRLVITIWEWLPFV